MCFDTRMPASPLIRLTHSWLDDGHALVAGSLFVALGMTMFSHAGLLTGDDLARWQPTVEPSVSVDYAGLTVHKTGS